MVQPLPARDRKIFPAAPLCHQLNQLPVNEKDFAIRTSLFKESVASTVSVMNRIGQPSRHY
jgi:hypothetical protein